MTPDKSLALLIAVFISGFVAGYMVHIRVLPKVERLGITDGAICFAVDSRTGDPTAGAHWLVRSDGICYAEDSPK